MLRESELITQLVPHPTWKRIDRMLAEATNTDSGALSVMLIGLAVLVLAAVLAG